MGNTNQGSSGVGAVGGERSKHRRPSTSEPLGPLEIVSPMASQRYNETTPPGSQPSSQARFGRNLLDSLHNDGAPAGVEQYTRRYRAGSISMEIQPNTLPVIAPPPTLVKKDTIPAVIKWDKGGKEVYVSGSFNGWEKKIPLVKSEKNFYTIVELAKGEHEYKFCIDGQWRHNPDEPVTSNSSGTINNVMRVAPEDFQILEALESDGIATTVSKKTEAFISGRPPNEDTDEAMEEDYGREIPTRKSTDRQTGPPILPPHLLQVILNKDVSEHLEPGMLPEPNTVILNHLYALSIKDGVMVLSDTSRYKKKYVTTLLYKPID